MGSKISELTETGVAPTGGYIPIEHESQNYKISIKTLNEGGLGGGGGGYIDSATVLTKGSNTATFSDFNKDTQIIVAQPVSSTANGYPEYSIETVELIPDSSVTATITQDSTTSFTVTLSLSNAGVVTASHNKSISGKINLMRFTKASATQDTRPSGGEGGIIGYVYCTLPGGGTHEEVLEIDFANQTQSGRNTYNNDLANFHLVDLPQGDIIDMHRPTDASGSVASWSSDTDFSDCNVLGASGAESFHQPWVMMGNWNKLDSNYVPVGYREEEYWVAKFENDKLHIKPNPDLTLADGNVRTFYFAVTKGGGGGQAAQPSSGVNYILETMTAGGTLEKKDTSFFEMHVRQLEKESILAINPADDTFTGFDHSSSRFTTGTLDAVAHKDVVYIGVNNKFQAKLDSNGDYNFYGQTTNGNDFYALIKRY